MKSVHFFKFFFLWSLRLEFTSILTLEVCLATLSVNETKTQNILEEVIIKVKSSHFSQILPSVVSVSQVHLGSRAQSLLCDSLCKRDIKHKIYMRRGY